MSANYVKQLDYAYWKFSQALSQVVHITAWEAGIFHYYP